MPTQPKNRTLHYVHDPMCSWCYAFRPVWQALQEALPADITVNYVVGGLAQDSAAPMPEAMQAKLISTWQHITQAVPGTTFNFDFWKNNQPRRSTYPSCRAVLAAKKQDARKEQAMIAGIQDAYYQQALNPSDDEVLVGVADSIGLEARQFADDLNSAAIHSGLQQELAFARSIGGNSFPSLILQEDDSYRLLMLSYTEKDRLLAQL